MNVDYYVKKQRITVVFSRNALYMHFFEIGSIYTFSILELLKLPKIAQISTPVRLYCAFLVGGKMAVVKFPSTEGGSVNKENPATNVSCRFRAVSLFFFWSVEQNARDMQMTTRVTENTRRERLPPSFLASRGFAAQRSCARALPLLNLKKKRDCSQSTFPVVTRILSILKFFVYCCHSDIDFTKTLTNFISKSITAEKFVGNQ